MLFLQQEAATQLEIKSKKSRELREYNSQSFKRNHINPLIHLTALPRGSPPIRDLRGPLSKKEISLLYFIS